MVSKRKNFFSLTLMGIILSSFSVPAFAEVESIDTDRLFYSPGDTITFSGTVDGDDTGLITIVIRDSNDKFVLLTQAFIKPDNSFERNVDTSEKFSSHGIYNASAFLVNMTEGSLTRFDYSLDGSQVNPSVVSLQNSNDKTTVTISQNSVKVESPPEPISKIASFVDITKDTQYYIDRYNNEIAYKQWFDSNYPDLTIEEAVGLTKIVVELTTAVDLSQFIDPKVDPQYYIDRYNNEIAYKQWFDSNYPDLTIEEAVGVTPIELTQEKIDDSIIKEPPIVTQELSENLVESSTVNASLDTENSEVGQMLLALGGLGILFGAVYGVKRKVDSNTVQIEENKTKLDKKVHSNTDQITQNRFWLKKKLMSLKPGEDPVAVIKERLAKGEITVEEYYKLQRALKK